MNDNGPGYNSAYLSLNLLDELDYYLAGYGKPNVEFLFTLNTFVETFIGSSEFYTSLDELNHLNLTSTVLFPNGRPILNLVVKEGGLKFVNGVVNNPSTEIYRGIVPNVTRKDAQRDFVISYGAKISDNYFIKSDINKTIDKIPLITSKFDDDVFIVSEVKSTTNELVSNLMNVCGSTSIQTSLPIYLYAQQVDSFKKKPYSIKSLDIVAKMHEVNLEALMQSLDYQYLPIPAFTNILLGQVKSIYEVPAKLAQLRADFQTLRDKFVELEVEIAEAPNIKRQLEAYNKYKAFLSVFVKKYIDKKHRIFYGNLDIIDGSDLDKGVDSLLDGSDFLNAFKDINLGKIAGNTIIKGFNYYRDSKTINRFKGLTNIWELFQDSMSLGQQINHVERLFSVKFSSEDIYRVNNFVKTRVKNITNEIK